MNIHKMNILKFLMLNLIIIHKGTAFLKLKSTFIISLLTYPSIVILESVGEWFDINYMYVYFVFGAVAIDHILGTYVHGWIKKDFSVKQNIKGFLIKTTLIIFVDFLGNGVVHILGDNNLMSEYFKTMMRLMVFVYPAGSALMNASIISNGDFPFVGFLKKIKRFKENLDVDEFTGKKPDDMNP